MEALVCVRLLLVEIARSVSDHDLLPTPNTRATKTSTASIPGASTRATRRADETMAGDAYREYCRAQHRAIGHYLASRAWLLGVDCVVLDRRDLEALLDLRRFKQERLAWLERDLLPWFPHQKLLYYSNKPGRPFASMYLSRVSFDGLPDDLMSRTMSPQVRVARMNEQACGLKTALLAERHAKRVTLVDIAAELAVSMAGLVAPKR
jgi:hypothetical protein